MNIDRTGAIARTGFDAGARHHAAGAEQRGADEPSFELPTPPDPDAAPDAHTRMQKRGVAADRELRPHAANKHHADLATGPRQSSSPPEDRSAPQRAPAADAHDAPPPRANAAAARAANQRGDGERSGRAGRRGDVENATPTETPAGQPTRSHDSDPDAAPSDASTAVPSLAERMLALLSGTLAGREPARAQSVVTAGGTLMGARGTAPVAGGVALAAITPAPENLGAALIAGVGLQAEAAASTQPATTTTALPAAIEQPVPAALALPAGASALPAMSALPTIAPGAGAAGVGLGTTLALANTSREDSDDSAAAPLAPGVIDATGALARLSGDPVATRIVQAAVLAMPADLDAGFGDELGSRIVWMAEQKLGHAEIRLNPENLGPIDVRLQMDGHRISAQFQAANPDVRHALESGMGRLRDLLGHHGMELADSHVGGQHPRRGDHAGAAGDRRSGSTSDAGDMPAGTTTLRTLRARGLIDEYV